MPSQEKNGNPNGLAVLPGGLYTKLREPSPEEWLEQEVQTWAACGKRSEGTCAYVSRAIADIADKIRWPHRVPARIIREALEGKARVAWARRFGELLSEYADRKARAMGVEDDQPNKVA